MYEWEDIQQFIFDSDFGKIEDARADARAVNNNLFDDPTILLEIRKKYELVLTCDDFGCEYCPNFQLCHKSEDDTFEKVQEDYRNEYFYSDIPIYAAKSAIYDRKYDIVNELQLKYDYEVYLLFIFNYDIDHNKKLYNILRERLEDCIHLNFFPYDMLEWCEDNIWTGRFWRYAFWEFPKGLFEWLIVCLPEGKARHDLIDHFTDYPYIEYLPEFEQKDLFTEEDKAIMKTY